MKMMKLTCVLVLVLVTIVIADEPDCNKTQEDKEKALEKLANCCKSGDIIDDSVVNKCKEDVMPKGYEPDVNNMGPLNCLGECTLTKIGFFANNNIDRDGAVKYLSKQSHGDSNLLTHWTNSFDMCLTKANAHLGVPQNAKVSENKVCNPISSFMMGCMLNTIIKNCPSSIWTGGSECDALKAQADKCTITVM